MVNKATYYRYSTVIFGSLRENNAVIAQCVCNPSWCNAVLKYLQLSKEDTCT